MVPEFGVDLRVEVVFEVEAVPEVGEVTSPFLRFLKMEI